MKQKHVLLVKTFTEAGFVSITTSKLVKNAFESLLYVSPIRVRDTDHRMRSLVGGGVHLPLEISKLRSLEKGLEMDILRRSQRVIMFLFSTYGVRPSHEIHPRSAPDLKEKNRRES